MVFLLRLFPPILSLCHPFVCSSLTLFVLLLSLYELSESTTCFFLTPTADCEHRNPTLTAASVLLQGKANQREAVSEEGGRKLKRLVSCNMTGLL